MYQFVVLMVTHMPMIVNDRRREFLLFHLTLVRDKWKKDNNLTLRILKYSAMLCFCNHGRHRDLVNSYVIYVLQMINEMS